ncbi:hypothetical protein LJC10_06480, partial [Selenomonadales bacterium OttesenSCG-928-I06]|nr:hypothetical protein [Selenomonadales bacterium OttesenSCG-928-I06]
MGNLKCLKKDGSGLKLKNLIPFSASYLTASLLCATVAASFPVLADAATYPEADITSQVKIDNGKHTNYIEDTVILVNSTYNNYNVWVTGTGSKLTIADGKVLTLIDKTSDNYADNFNKANGIYAANGGVIELGKVDVTVYHGALYAASGGKVTAGHDSKLHALGSEAGVAIVSDGIGSEVTVGNNAKIIGGVRGFGTGVVDANSGGKVKIGNKAYILSTTLGGIEDGYGNTTAPLAKNYFNYFALSVFMGGSIEVGTDSTIEVKVTDNFWHFSGALCLLSNSEASKGYITIGDRATINASGKMAVGILCQTYGEVKIGANSTITTDGADGYGVYSDDNSIVTLGASNTVTTNQKDSYGLIATRAGDIVAGEGLTITTKGEGSYAVFSEIDSSIDIAKGATITANNANVIVAEAGEIKLAGAKVVADTSKDYKAFSAVGNDDTEAGIITADGIFNIKGNIAVDEYGTVNLTMRGADRSIFNGATEFISDTGSEINFNLYNATWNISEDSKLTTLSLDGTTGAQVNFAGSDFGTTLTVDKLNHSTDGGVFAMRVDAAEQTSDKVIINEVDNSGISNHKIFVSDYKTPGSTKEITGDEEIILVEVTGINKDNAAFGLSNTNGQTIEKTDLRGFQYELFEV